MILKGIFQCQECGATGTTLTQADDKRIVCEDAALCEYIKNLQIFFA